MPPQPAVIQCRTNHGAVPGGGGTAFTDLKASLSNITSGAQRIEGSVKKKKNEELHTTREAKDLTVQAALCLGDSLYFSSQVITFCLRKISCHQAYQHHRLQCLN